MKKLLSVVLVLVFSTSANALEPSTYCIEHAEFVEELFLARDRGVTRLQVIDAFPDDEYAHNVINSVFALRKIDSPEESKRIAAIGKETAYIRCMNNITSNR
ncbi:hypothetical protein [Marinobacter shengliensis]|uniref:hypothetical protein n=1 Tax=Marinobacter shengliensis TaxID=1389223 RepID=UPI001E644A83|nr:hypothetical protein [Marinobacter shengliensis]MCD1628506.1 hypothetical protein [Marinobacter shengliensis]